MAWFRTMQTMFIQVEIPTTWRVSHSNGAACPPQRLLIGWGANRFGLNLIFAEKGLYENRVPEVSLAQILRHPRYSERLALFEGMKGFPYVTPDP